MVIHKECFDSFCEIVQLGFEYYENMMCSFPGDIRHQEQLMHLNSIQDSIYKYDSTKNKGLHIRSMDKPYCIVLLQDADEFCDEELLLTANALLEKEEGIKGQ